MSVGHYHPQPNGSLLCLWNLEALDELHAERPYRHARKHPEGQLGLAVTEVGRELVSRGRPRGHGKAVIDPNT